MLELFYITNNPDIATACERAGIDRIFIDMEYIGKDKRQHGLDTVKNHHTVDDIINVKKVLKKAKLLVRINPVHENSKHEVDCVVAAGADYIMLPMWKSPEEVEKFISFVNGRVKTILLLETEEARLCLDDVLKIHGIDEIYIGLNDLHLSQHKNFMFELYTDGTVDEIVSKLKAKNVKFGIGGVGRVNCENTLPAENILCEHYRLGSSMVILARAFCDWTKYSVNEFEKIMTDGIAQNRNYENEIAKKDKLFFDNIHKTSTKIIQKIVSNK